MSSVLHTPVKSIIAMRKGITALVAMGAASLCWDKMGAVWMGYPVSQGDLFTAGWECRRRYWGQISCVE